MKDETKCLHAGYQPKNAEPRVMPIVQSTTYVYDSTEEVAAVFDDPMKSLIYSRFGNPTVMAVEDKIAELEGGIGAMCTTSGQAAVLLSLLNICNAGDSFISTTEIYGGSVNLFSHTLRRLGIACIYIDKNATDEEIDAAFQSNTKAVFGETIANPALTVFDMERFAAIAHKHGVPLIIDNTFATPILCKPFEFGADIIVHSTSKYMDGHAVQVGGAIVDSGNFDWTNGRFPDLTEPDESYHGISYTETYGKKAYIVKARMQLMRDFGVYPAAHSAFLLNLGLETLAVRMKQYCENAMTVAKYLEQSDKVEKVNYPGLESDESYGLARKYLNGCSGVISFVIKGGKEAAVKFMNKLQLASNEVHVSDIRTCVLHPASETHRQLTDEQLVAAGIEQGFYVIAAGAFIAEHSVFPSVASGRPDDKDKAAMKAFAAKCCQILSIRSLKNDKEISLPGTQGYDGFSYEGVPFKPDGDDKCVACGECRRICPQNAISEGDFRKTDNELCIACGACIKVCPAGARNYHCEAYEEVKKDFEKMCSEYRVPELFYMEEAE